MNFSNLSMTDKLIGLGGIVGLVGTILPWYSVSYSLFGVSSGVSVNGLRGVGLIAFIAAVLAVLMVVLPLLNVKLPKLPLDTWLVNVILGAAVAGAAVIAYLQIGGSGVSFEGLGGSAGVSYGLFVTIAGGALIAWGGFQSKGKA